VSFANRAQQVRFPLAASMMSSSWPVVTRLPTSSNVEEESARFVLLLGSPLFKELALDRCGNAASSDCSLEFQIWVVAVGCGGPMPPRLDLQSLNSSTRRMCWSERRFSSSPNF